MSFNVSNDEIKGFLIDHNVNAIAVLVSAKVLTLGKLNVLAKEFMADDPTHQRDIRKTMQEVSVDINPILGILPTMEEILQRCLPQQREGLNNLIIRVSKS